MIKDIVKKLKPSSTLRINEISKKLETDGKKIYDNNCNIFGKCYNDKDFTAIKRFLASNISVCFLSGDNWNKKIWVGEVIRKNLQLLPHLEIDVNSGRLSA